MSWEDGKKRCSSLRMILPSRKELILSYKKGVIKKWTQEYKKLEYAKWWTSEEYDSELVYYFDGLTDLVEGSIKSQIFHVTCIR